MSASALARALHVPVPRINDIVRERRGITAALVFGSVAKGSDTAVSDIDLMVISDSLTCADIFGALEPTAERLGRPVNPTVYSGQEFSKRIREENSFVTRVLAGRKIWIIGSDDDIEAG